MSLADTFTNETRDSSTFNPVNPVSQISIYGTFTGNIALQSSSPGTGRWIDVYRLPTGQSGVVKDLNIIDTPDTLRDYRFSASGIVGTAYVYFGE